MDKYIGKMLDNRYEILEVIGMGGMAVVYKARCHRLNRLVAVKVLKEDFSEDDDFRRRFHAESQAVAMLSHPNIVAVYDVSRSSELEYIVMELIDGITLKQYMQKKGMLNWRESLHFITQIVKALSHAHNRGIIHRDIKPHNIMILRDGSVKVADFGIARFASKQNTLTQEALGSVHYISPEQARGSHIDARSDLYSVGVVLYEMLTGRLPYEGDSPVSVAIQHISSMPLSPKEINASIPDALEEITKKAMAANPAKRYSSAEDMLTALEEFRKNPAVNFSYNLGDTSLDADEPTRALPRAAVIAGAAKEKARSDAKQKRGRPGRPRQDSRNDRDEDEDFKTRRSNSTVAMLTGTLGVLVFLGVLAYIVVTLVNSIVNPEAVDMFVVPNFVSSIYDEQAIQNEYPQFRFDTKPSSSSAYDAGYIIKQDPPRNQEVAEGTVITLTISTGPVTFQMKGYAEMGKLEAQIALQSEGLRYKVETEYHDTIERDTVIRTKPAEGEIVTEGQEVILYVSLGQEKVYYKMANFLGATLATAKRELELHNITVIEDVVDSDAPVDQVVGQSVQNGVDVEEGSSVTLTVSGGMPATPTPEPTPTPTPPPTPTPTPPPTPIPTIEPQRINYPISILLPYTDGEPSVSILVEVKLISSATTSTEHHEYHQSLEKVINLSIYGYPGDTIDAYLDGQIVQSWVIGS